LCGSLNEAQHNARPHNDFVDEPNWRRIARDEFGEMDNLISTLLPAGVAVVEVVDDVPGAALFPEEEKVIAKAVDKRRREFTLGRDCARRALTRLGVPPQSILSGPHREPMWPAGVVGSITHCDGYCAAAVAHRWQLATIGIDVEVHDQLPEGVLDDVALEDERKWLGGHWAGDIHWDRVLFSAKESIYKAWFPLTGIWLEFKDTMVIFDPDSRTFVARLLNAGLCIGEHPIHEFAGRFRVEGGLIATAVSLDALHS